MMKLMTLAKMMKKTTTMTTAMRRCGVMTVNKHALTRYPTITIRYAATALRDVVLPSPVSHWKKENVGKYLKV